ncbi:uncharacterized protein [Choristoneura fumiferana]|uniref:uncharacterized protein n=1 Tax=Choristoneura fumiferana TaxID=7141 RepID=UPI003D159E6E
MFRTNPRFIFKICWWASPFRWLGENPPSAPCAASGLPCDNWDCRERACTCALLRPARGALAHAHAAELHFKVNSAPDSDRCVATLVQLRRTLGDVCAVSGAAGCCARGSLLAYRVLAPRLVLRVLPCQGDKTGDCKECRLDPGLRASPRGCAVLRPSAALAQGHRSCYTLRVTNLTPIPTTVQWEPPVEGDDVLKVEFIPNDFDIGSYGEKEIQVVLEAQKVCGRRLFAHRARLAHAYKPLYLLIDAAIEGVKVIIEVPLGVSEGADSFVTLRSTQSGKNYLNVSTNGAVVDYPIRRRCTQSRVYSNDFDIGSYGEKEIQVVLEAQKVCGRRLFAHRARLAHAYKPLYLLIDAAIEGVKVIIEVPLGVSEGADSFVTLRSTQKEVFSSDNHNKPATAAECFAENDRKIAVIRENTCHCHFEMVYIPPPVVQRPPPDLEEVDYEYQPVEIITEPPPFTRVCPCDKMVKPILPDHVQPFCLQFREVPLRTVTTRTLLLRNVGALEARWRVVVRRWPRVRDRAAATEALAAGTDRWAGDVRAPGVALQCAPAAGACAAGARAAIDVAVYADCWGCYRDQLLIMVEGVEPVVVDVWVEVVGRPLKFATAGDDPEYDATMWLSESDQERTLRVKNTSRSQLTVHAYTLLEHEYPQDALPFRLYMRFFDVLPPTCPCLTAVPLDEMLGEVSAASSSIPEEMDTGIELFLAADFGPQNYDCYKVEPQSCVVAAGAWQKWRVSLLPRVGGAGAAGLLLLRTLPDDDRGRHYRNDTSKCLKIVVFAIVSPGGAASRRRRARVPRVPRAAQLRLSCRELRVRLCALDLPFKDVVRVRKRFRVQNTGSAPLAVSCAGGGGGGRAWRLVRGEPRGGLCGCSCVRARGERRPQQDMLLEPRSSTAMCVEVCVHTEEVWPAAEAGDDCQPASYPPQRIIQGEMTFYSEQGLLQTLPLMLEVEYPQLFLEPAALDFGFVADGDTRKTYFTVWHSSLSSTIDLSAAWSGGEQFRLFPRRLRLPPGARQRIYLQYTARWSGGPSPAEGCAAVRADAGAGAWCRAGLRARAQPARDHKCRAPAHDHTDDPVLLPPKH